MRPRSDDTRLLESSSWREWSPSGLWVKVWFLMKLDGLRRLGDPKIRGQNTVGGRPFLFADLIFRFRFGLHVSIYAVGFALSWAGPRGASLQRVWLALPELAASSLRLDLRLAVVVMTAIAILFATVGAFLRTWGTAYLDSGVVFDAALRGPGLTVTGRFRYLRNPLYLGTLFHTLALCVLMSWVGAVFTLAAIAILQGTLIYAEERFWVRTAGPEYMDYRSRVPRIVPHLASSEPWSTLTGKWPQAVAGEAYMWGVALSFVVLGWRYNSLLVLQGVLVSLGVSIVIRGVMATRPAARPPSGA